MHSLLQSGHLHLVFHSLPIINGVQVASHCRLAKFGVVGTRPLISSQGIVSHVTTSHLTSTRLLMPFSSCSVDQRLACCLQNGAYGTSY